MLGVIKKNFKNGSLAVYKYKGDHISDLGPGSFITLCLPRSHGGYIFVDSVIKRGKSGLYADSAPLVDLDGQLCRFRI